MHILNRRRPRRAPSLAQPSRFGRSGVTVVLCIALLSGAFAAVGFDATPAVAANSATWSQLTPANDPPGLQQASMAFDQFTNQLILVGATASDTSEETWEWTGINWQQLAPTTSPPARDAAAFAYDPAGSDLVLFGGLSGSTYLGDTWNWNGTNWSQLTTPSPSPRDGASIAYDNASGQLVLFGGYNGSYLGDTWTYSAGAWTDLLPTSAVTPRSFSAMVYDPNVNELMLFSGDASPTYADIWLWNGSAWSDSINAGEFCPSACHAVADSYDSPGDLGASAIAYDPGENVALEVGGFMSPPSTDVTSNEWDWISDSIFTPSDSPSARANAAMAYDPNTNQLVLFGGYNGQYLNDTWVYGAPQPAACTAFSDNFGTDPSLQSEWSGAASEPPVVSSVAAAEGQTYESPNLSFLLEGGTGMQMAGVNGVKQMTAIATTNACTGGFTFTTQVFATQADGNAFTVALVNDNDPVNGPGGGYSVEGNLNPANVPFYGIWGGDGLDATQTGSLVDTDPAIFNSYTITLNVDASGKVTGTVAGPEGSFDLPTGSVPLGAISILLGQREGGPNAAAVGPNTTIWQSANLSFAAASVSASITAATPTVGSVESVPDSVADSPGTASGATTTSTADASSAPLASIDLSSSPLGSIPLASIPLASISVGGTNSINQSLGSTLLSQLTINYPAGCGASTTPCTGWAGVLAGTYLANDPLQDVTLADVLNNSTTLAAFDSVDLAALGLSSSPLASIPLASIALGSAPLASIPLNGSTDGSGALSAWCSALSTLGYSCSTNFGITPSTGTTTVTLLDLALAGVPLASIPLGSIPLGSIPLASIPLASIPLASINLTSSPLASIPLASIPLASIPLGSIPLGSIELAQTPLASIPLASIGDLSNVCVSVTFNCSGPGATLGQALSSGALAPGATLAELGSYGATTLGQIVGSYDSSTTAVTNTTLAELLLNDVTTTPGYPTLTLANVIGGLEPPSSYPWSDIDLATLPLAADESLGGSDTFTTTLNVGPGGGAVNVAVTLPSGFSYVSGTAQLDGTSITPTSTGSTVTFNPTLTGGTHALSLVATAGIGLGATSASVSASIGGSSASSSSTSVNVVDALTGDNTAATATALVPNTLNFGYLTSATDTDLYSITVSRDQELSLDLSNLSSEYDLAVFAPSGGQLQGTPMQSIGGVTDNLPTLSPATSNEPVPGSSDIPETPPPGYSLYAISNNSGGADQTIQTPPLTSGTYLVQISGYNGAASTNPYLLRARLVGASGSQSCPALSYTTNLPISTATTPTIPANANTLFLTDTQRMTGEYGASSEAQIASDLQSVASDAKAGVVGAIVPVDAYANVQAAYSAFNADPCSIQAANGVVAAISSVVDQIRAANPTIVNVVIVGADDQIPFARVADGTTDSNERDYSASTFAGENNVEADALGLGYYFSDDPFGAQSPLGVGSATLYTPQLAIGRLVENPTEIESALTRFVSSSGNLDATAGLSTGYSFLSAAAKEVAANLATDAGLNPVSQLISETWSHSDLDSALTSTPTPQVDSVNAHFDYSRALPAIGNSTQSQTDLFTTADVNANQATYGGRLLFSMGCHAGLEIDSAEIGASGVTTPVADWAKTFADAGALWVANTGYGYGDTSTIAYSTKLMAMFAGNLNGATTIGQALTEAKQQYAAQNVLLSPYDLKSLMESTYYGLPMYHLNSSPAPITPTVSAPATTSDPITNLTVAPIAADLSLGKGTGELSEVAGANGTNYFQVNGTNAYNPSTQTTEYRPIEPLTTINVTQPSASSPGSLSLVAHGALVTGLSSMDYANFSPTISNPALDSGTNEVAPTIGNAAFPGSLQRVATFQGFSSNGAGITQNQQLDLVAGQFIPGSATSGVGTERLFTSIAGDVYYLNPSSPLATDFTPATIVSSQAVTSGAATEFSVDATDPGAAIKRVFVLYTDAANPGAWSSLDLSGSDGQHFSGSAPATASGTLDYIVQVVDAAGNVAVSNNQGTDFSSTVATGVMSSGPISIALSGATETDGYFNGPVGASISAPSDSTFVLDGSLSTMVPSGPVTVTGEGLHVLVVTDPSGDVTTENIDISAVPPTILATTTPVESNNYVPGAIGANPGSDLVVTATADAPITSVSYSETGAQTTSGAVTTTTVPVTIPLTKDGATTVAVTVTDAAGLVSTSNVTVHVDATAPSVVCTAPPTAAWRTANVSVACTATDGESGLAANALFATFTPASATFALSTTAVPGSASTSTTPSATVCNNVGSCTTVGPFGPYKIDLTTPVISTSTSPASMNGYLPGLFPGSTGSVLKVGATSAAGLASVSYTETGAQTVATPVTSSTVPVNIPLTANGTTIVTITAVDVAGVSTTTKVTVKVDALAPAVTCTTPSTATWYSSNVVVKCTATDAESGLASMPLYSLFTSTQSSFSLATTVGSGQSSPSAVTGTGKVCNVLGNCTTVGPFGPFKVDLIPPTIAITSPTASNYIVGAAAKVAFSCADGGSGLASCLGTQSNGSALPTTSPGTYSFKVTATDLAGNVTTKTVTYTVGYAICPFSGSLTVGKTALFVVAVCNASGKNVTSAATTATALNIDGTTAVVPVPSIKSSSFQYLGQYLPFPFFGLEYYAISTAALAKGSHVLNFSIAGDPTSHSVAFTV